MVVAVCSCAPHQQPLTFVALLSDLQYSGVSTEYLSFRCWIAPRPILRIDHFRTHNLPPPSVWRRTSDKNAYGCVSKLRSVPLEHSTLYLRYLTRTILVVKYPSYRAYQYPRTDPQIPRLPTRTKRLSIYFRRFIHLWKHKIDGTITSAAFHNPTTNLRVWLTTKATNR